MLVSNLLLETSEMNQELLEMLLLKLCSSTTYSGDAIKIFNKVFRKLDEGIFFKSLKIVHKK